jgi:hypothetical protein
MQSHGRRGGGECRLICKYRRAGKQRNQSGLRLGLLSLYALVVLCAACAGAGAGSLSYQAAKNGLPTAALIAATIDATDSAILAARYGAFVK